METPQLSHQVWLAWRAFEPGISGPVTTPDLNPRCPVALRARHHILRHPPSQQNPQWFQTPWDDWQAEISLVERGEAAIRAGELADAEALFLSLLEFADHEQAHPMRRIDALIGLGDVARTAGQWSAALELYRQATDLSKRWELPFGWIRAQVPLLHMERRRVAAGDLLARADALIPDAKLLGDPIYLANIEMFRAEVLALTDDRGAAVAAAEAAERYFDGNPVGMAGLYVRLGDIYRMAEDQAGLRTVLDRLFQLFTYAALRREHADALDLQAAWHMMRKEYHEAISAASQALEVAQGASYPEGETFANTTLAQAYRKLGDIPGALARRSENIARLRLREDTQAQLAYELIERAELLIANGHTTQAAQDIVDGMTALETLRCEQSSPTSQREYRKRFAQVYRRCLEAALNLDDASLFAMTFEGLWGRRLAGLVDEPRHFADALAEAQLIAQGLLSGDVVDPRPASRRRLLGAAPGAAPSGSGAEPAAEELAALSRPYTVQSAQTHVADIPRGTAALLVARVPERPNHVAALVIGPEGLSTGSIYEIPDHTVAAINAFNRDGYRGTAEDLGRLSDLLPRELATVPQDVPLLVIPLEDLWALPWPAIPIPTAAPEFLGERYPLRLCPSLSVAAAVRKRTLPAPRRGQVWVSPDVHPDFWMGQVLPAAESAAAMRAMILDGEPDQDAILVAHAIPTDGIAHVAALDAEHGLTPLDAMGACPPGRVALLTCWSAHVPGESPGDPLTLATVLLARGAVCVLATSGELANEPLSGLFSLNVVHNQREHDWSRALQWTIRQFARVGRFSQELSCWIPLRVLGAW